MVRRMKLRIFTVFLSVSLFAVFQVFQPKYLILLSSPLNYDVCSDSSGPTLGVPNSLMKIENCSSCQAITCRDLLFSKPEQNKLLYKKAKELMSKYADNFNEPRRNKILEVIEKNCEEFKKWRGYDLSVVSQEEMYEREPFPIAFNILGHEGFEQTERLLRAIYRPQNSYCFHIDKKSTEMINDIKLLSSCFDNVFLSSKLEYIIYAGFSRLQADLNCMKDQMNRKEKWRYLINTASSGFPLKSNKELVQILKIINGSNIIVTIPTKHNKYLISRYKYVHEVRDGKLFKTKTLHSPPPYNLTIVKGSAYGIFSRPFINFILTDIRVQVFLKWTQKTYSPDELFWNTLHHTYSNPHIDAPGGLKKNVKQLAGFQVNWAGEDICLSHFVRGVCIFGIGDLPMLRESPRLFLNKFNQSADPLAMECMENYLKYRRICPPKLNITFYENL